MLEDLKAPNLTLHPSIHTLSLTQHTMHSLCSHEQRSDCCNYIPRMEWVQYAGLHPFACPKIGGSEELVPEPLSQKSVQSGASKTVLTSARAALWMLDLNVGVAHITRGRPIFSTKTCSRKGCIPRGRQDVVWWCAWRMLQENWQAPMS